MAYSGQVPNYIEINRSQLSWGEIDIEALVPASHPARAIWAMSARFDLSGFEQAMKNDEGGGGRPCWPPRLLFSVWVYAYTQGIASARAVERMMEYEPGLRWLCGGQLINYHTLSDFRISHKEKLEDLMSQLMAVLDEEQLIELRTVAHDGTKIRAQASKYSFHRQRTLRDRAKVARRVVRQLHAKAEAEEQAGGADARKQAAERRAAEEQLKRLESSLRKLKGEQERVSPSKRDEVRVSRTEPQARKMKQPDGGWAPSYNVQISTDAKHRMIVGLRVSDAAADVNELKPALAMVRKWCGRKPERVLADGGYASRENVAAMDGQKVELIAPWKAENSREAGASTLAGREAAFRPSAFQMSSDGTSMICPAGKLLQIVGEGKHHGQLRTIFEAQAGECGICAVRDACCGTRPGPRRVARVRETAAMQSYLHRMSQPDTQQLYKKRSEVAEFPNLWIKSYWRLRRFSLRGKIKVAKEAIWAALAYNIQQWIRLRWSPVAI